MRLKERIRTIAQYAKLGALVGPEDNAVDLMWKQNPNFCQMIVDEGLKRRGDVLSAQLSQCIEAKLCGIGKVDTIRSGDGIKVSMKMSELELLQKLKKTERKL